MAQIVKRQGILFCLVGPTGAGKTELAKYLINNHENTKRSISATTRDPRPEEIDKESYYFLSEDAFLAKVRNNEFIEYERVHGNYYGTLKTTVESALTDEVDLILDIDVKGAFNFKARMGRNTVVVFILPPSFKTLQKRIESRGGLSREEYTKRMETAKIEYKVLMESISEGKLRGRDKVDYILINDVFKSTCESASDILMAERLKLSRIHTESVSRLLKIETL